MRVLWDDYDKGFGQFHAGQQVVAVAAPEGSKFKNGSLYIVSEYVWKPSTNPIAHGKPFWYIGIVGHAVGVCGHPTGYPCFYPGLFAPVLSQFKEMEYTEVLKIEKKLTCAN